MNAQLMEIEELEGVKARYWIKSNAPDVIAEFSDLVSAILFVKDAKARGNRVAQWRIYSTFELIDGLEIISGSAFAEGVEGQR